MSSNEHAPILTFSQIFSGKNVTLRAVNNLKGQHFQISVNLPDTHSQFLIDMMKEAAGIEPGFDR